VKLTRQGFEVIKSSVISGSDFYADFRQSLEMKKAGLIRPYLAFSELMIKLTSRVFDGMHTKSIG
jgi:hypothetical protein